MSSSGMISAPSVNAANAVAAATAAAAAAAAATASAGGLNTGVNQNAMSSMAPAPSTSLTASLNSTPANLLQPGAGLNLPFNNPALLMQALGQIDFGLVQHGGMPMLPGGAGVFCLLHLFLSPRRVTLIHATTFAANRRGQHRFDAKLDGHAAFLGWAASWLHAARSREPEPD
jgi:hypothetical protein